MKNKINTLILVLLFLSWLLPVLQSCFNLLPVQALGGVAPKKAGDTLLTADSWFDGKYAEKKQNFLTDSFGFRPSFIRLRNQIKFSFFGSINVQDVIVGKDNNLFEMKYINSYFGLDYVGRPYLEAKAEKLKFVQDAFKKLNKTLIVILAPSKAAFCPEYIPLRYRTNNTITNYAEFKPLLIKNHINTIDYALIFKNLKATSKHRLFTRAGTHWSNYSTYIVLDSLLQYIENKTDFVMPLLDYSKVTYSDKDEGTDNDIRNALNLIAYPDYGKIAHAELKITEPINLKKPNVLVVGDSFWDCVYKIQTIIQTFNTNTFYYYNNLVNCYYCENERKKPEDIDLLAELNKNDVICIVATEPNIKSIGWGFIEDCYDLFKNGTLNEADRKRRVEIELSRSYMWNDTRSFNNTRMISLKENRPQDSVIFGMVRYMYEISHPK